MDRFFELVGRFVVRHPRKVIITCISLTVLCLLKTINTDQTGDILAYAPLNARSRYEYAVYQEFFGHNGQGIMNYVLVQAKDNGTMIRVPQLNETVRVLDNISRNFKIYNRRLNKSQSFDEFCTGFCQLNEPVRQFYNGLVIQDSQLNPRIRLRYPVTTMFSRKFSIQASFFGVELNNSSNDITNIKKSSMVVLQFRAEKDQDWDDDAVLKYEQAIADYYTSQFQSDYIRVLVISPSYVAHEVERSGLALQPLLVIGFCVMVVFSIGTTIISSTYVNQSLWKKVILALSACIVPLMACISAFGLSFLLGLRFSPIIAVTPFLVLAIGVDDSFIMTFKLHQLSKQTLTVEEKITKVCTETGPSVCLSSVTNILAFLIGSLNATPEIQLFNIVNAIALTIDLIYSLTLYAAILTLYAQQNDDSKKSHIDFESCWRIRIYNRLQIYLDRYIKFLSNTWVSISIVMAIFLFCSFTLRGALNMDVNLRSDKFFLEDSKLLEADNLKQQYVTPTFTSLIIIVNHPGNLTDPKRTARLEELVSYLETLPTAIGPDSTKFFLRDYNDYLNAFNDEDVEHEFSLESVQNFLDWPEYSYYRGFLQFSNDGQLQKFFITTGFGGELLKEWKNRHAILDQWRRAIDKFVEFNATIYYEDALFLDLIDVLPYSTWQSLGLTLACIIITCYVFINDLFTVFITSMSVLFICIGEFGLLFYSGITLDPISMAAIIMTIGFSVDLPSHIAYHFHRTEFHPNQSQDIHERLKSTLSSVGFPVIQAGISTILCLSTLLLVQFYMPNVFVLTIGYCIGLSIIFSFVTIPVVLSLKSKIMIFFRSPSKKQSIAPHNILLHFI